MGRKINNKNELSKVKLTIGYKTIINESSYNPNCFQQYPTFARL